MINVAVVGGGDNSATKDRNSLMNDINASFYGGGQQQPTPTPMPTPVAQNGMSSNGMMLAGNRTERDIPFPMGTPDWLMHILRTTPNYPPGKKGDQFSPNAVPVLQGPSQLYYEPAYSGADQMQLVMQDAIRRMGMT